jgi:S-DNA-T family DNA segregation ATPase FtsK/SpoIIIE
VSRDIFRGLWWNLAVPRDRPVQPLALVAPSPRRVWVIPRLVRVSTSGASLSLTVRCRTGQTVDDIERAAPAIGAAAGAHSVSCTVPAPGRVAVELVMADYLTTARVAAAPSQVAWQCLSLGRRHDGSAWALPLAGRHTLVVGCSGSGKGSVFWGVCAGLAPAVSAGLARLWGIDLKRGVEVGMGRHLFTATATTPGEALTVLSRLLAVIDERGRAMAGVARLHEPTSVEPLHVVAIDELAVLTAYADPETRREGTRLLAEVLTQGRALGVVVVACAQDPRKEVIGLRGLFTQTVALRLRSGEETRMVLGDGTADLAPAHRISPAAPGTAWVLTDEGTADKVRADFWPDDLVRAVAAAHPAPVVESLTHAPPTDGEDEGPDLRVVPDPGAPAPTRSPRASRPRPPRTSTAGATVGGRAS